LRGQGRRFAVHIASVRRDACAVMCMPGLACLPSLNRRGLGAHVLEPA
jgi:hypothetical protein